MKKNKVFVALALCAAAMQLSCASAPPEWTVKTPQADAVNTWFVGMSTAADAATATVDATANLISGIMQYLGVKVTVNTSAVAKASLDSYSADISQAVKTESNGRLAGFQVKQKYLTENKSARTFTAYILASYSTVELAKEKLRLDSIFQEQIDAVAAPEAEGDAYAADGRVIDAVIKYIEAAAAASGSEIDNAAIKLARNINKARGLLAPLGFAYLGKEQKTASGRAFDAPFIVRLTALAGSKPAQTEGVDGRAGVPGAPLLVSYQAKQASGRLASKTIAAKTDSDGTLSFAPPAPDFVGKAKLVVRLDLQSSLELLDQLPPSFESERGALVDDILSKYIEVPYQVYSTANAIPTGICILDFDENGDRLSGDVSQSALMEALGKEKFQISSTPLRAGSVAAMDDQAVLSSARSEYGQSVKRILYGVVRLVSLRRDGFNFLAQVSGQVRVLDLVSGRTLYSADKTYTSVGASAAEAAAAALRGIGLQVFGKDMPASLP